MIPQIIEVKALEGYKLWLRFRDGMTGTVDLSGELWGTMFEPLKDRALFASAAVHPSYARSRGRMARTFLQSSSIGKPPNHPLQRARRKRRAAERKR